MGQYIRIMRWDEKEPDMGIKHRADGSRRMINSSVETLYKELVVFTGETSVQYLYNERLHGISKNGKHWFKFSTPRKIIYTIKPNAYGEMVGQFYKKEGRTFINISQNVDGNLQRMVGKYTTSSIGSDIFAAQIRKVAQAHAINVDDTISIYDQTFVYPVLRNLQLGRYAHGLPNEITRYAGTTDLGVFVSRAFGKTRYRKDLVKAVANLRSMNVFMLGYSFRGLVPIDWIIDFYRQYANKTYGCFNSEHFGISNRKVLYKLPEKQVKKLFKMLSDKNEINHTSNRDISDIFISLFSIYEEDLYEGIEHLKFTSLKEAHDKYATFAHVAQEKKRNAHFMEPLKKLPLAEQIDAIPYEDGEGIRLVTASRAMDLVEWGAMMGHCIGSYTRQALRGEGVFGAVVQHGKVIGNFHFGTTNERMIQVFGKHNQTLDADILIRMFELLIDHTELHYNNLSSASGCQHAYRDPRAKVLSSKSLNKTTKRVGNAFVELNGAVHHVNEAWAQLGYVNVAVADEEPQAMWAHHQEDYIAPRNVRVERVPVQYDLPPANHQHQDIQVNWNEIGWEPRN